MARTAEAIRAEYEALENKRSKDGHRLREELKALEGPSESVSVPASHPDLAVAPRLR